MGFQRVEEEFHQEADSLVSIIVPCWLLPDNDNALLKFTKKCVDSIRTHVQRPYELVLIDNASPVGVEYLKEQADVYIRNKVNWGYGPAINQGLKAANGEWLVAMNNDAELVDDWVSVAISAWGPETGAVSSFRYVDGSKGIRKKEVVGWKRMFGALWMTHQSVVANVGYFDEQFRYGMRDDRDYWVRMEKEGYQLSRVGWCKHKGNATWGKLPGHGEIHKENVRKFEEKWPNLARKG